MLFHLLRKTIYFSPNTSDAMDYLATFARATGKALHTASTEFSKELFASTPPTVPAPQPMSTAPPAKSTESAKKDTTPTVHLTHEQLNDYRRRLLSPRRK